MLRVLAIAGIQKLFPGKSQSVNIFIFVDQKVSVTTVKLYYCIKSNHKQYVN